MTMPRAWIYTLVALAAVGALVGTQAASLSRGLQLQLASSVLDSRESSVQGRQQGEYSGEDSDEDDDDDDAERMQLNALHRQQAAEASSEDSDEEADDDEFGEDVLERKRRDAPTPAEQPSKEAAAEALAASDAVEPSDFAIPGEDAEPAVVLPEAAVVTPQPPRNTSVLILIRDALKKVTSGLPTEQVTNALQYFQLFEHFLQQTIEQVIGDDYDEEEEATTIKAEVEEPNVAEQANKAPEVVGNTTPEEAVAEVPAVEPIEAMPAVGAVEAMPAVEAVEAMPVVPMLPHSPEAEQQPSTTPAPMHIISPVMVEEKPAIIIPMDVAANSV